MKCKTGLLYSSDDSESSDEYSRRAIQNVSKLGGGGKIQLYFKTKVLFLPLLRPG